MSEQKKSSHLGAGLLIGTALGVAAGLFLNTKKGKSMMKDAEQKAKKMQKTLMKELSSVTVLTKGKYEEIVDRLVTYYVKSKEIAKSEAPQIRRFLVAKWKEIEREVKAMKK